MNNTFNPINDAINIPQRPEQHINFTEVNMKYPYIGTCTMGQIVPFMFLPVLPGDYVRAKGEYLFRFAPMYLPILSQVKVYIDYFYVPLNLLWGLPKNALGNNAGSEIQGLYGWETFISSFDDSIELPKIDIPMDDYRLNAMDEIISHLGIPTQQDSSSWAGILQVVPFPFLAYLLIYDEHYRNDQVQDRRFFKWFEGQGYDYTTLVSAFSQIYQVPNNRLSMLRRNWDNDYFTIMTPTPQLGANVLIPMITDENFWETILTPGDYTSFPSRWRNLATGALAPTSSGVDIDPTSAGFTNAAGIVGLDIQETAASIRQLRVSLQMTEILERAMRTGDKYDDFVIKFFAEDPNPLVVDCPQWFGGHVGRVVVSDVYSTALTTSGGTPVQSVGSYAGNAVAVDHIGMAQVKIRDYGYIFGLLSVVPETSYQNGLPPHWQYSKWYDYPFEQFAQIGDREMKRWEMQMILEPQPGEVNILEFIENDTVLGYVPKDHEWRHTNAIVSGQMRTLWTSFHLGRILDQAAGQGIDLGDELLLCNPRISEIFQITIDSNYREHEVYILVHNDVKIDRRIAKYAIPQT